MHHEQAFEILERFNDFHRFARHHQYAIFPAAFDETVLDAGISNNPSSVLCLEKWMRGLTASGAASPSCRQQPPK